jgi:hypothetical protein
MGDYTYFTMTVHKMRPKKLLELENLIGFCPTYSSDPKHIEIGVTFNLDEVRCGSVFEWAPEIVKMSAPAVWEMHEDPKYEWLGTIAAYHPTVGLWVGDCDADGNTVVNYFRLESCGILAPDLSAEEVMAAQQKLRITLGRPQFEAIAKLGT